MHIIVIGCGRVGSELATSLGHAGHAVVVVDKERRAFARLPAGFDRTVTGIAFDRDTLRDAGVEQADALAAVTSGDNSNILAARVAREVFGVAQVVARIYDPRRAVIYERLGIDTVATVTWTTRQVLRRLIPDATPAEWVDPSGQVLLLERLVPPAWAGHRLADVEHGDGARIVALTRGGEAQIPSPSLLAQHRDILHIAVRGDAAAEDLDKRLATGPGGHA